MSLYRKDKIPKNSQDYSTEIFSLCQIPTFIIELNFSFFFIFSGEWQKLINPLILFLFGHPLCWWAQFLFCMCILWALEHKIISGAGGKGWRWWQSWTWRGSAPASGHVHTHRLFLTSSHLFCASAYRVPPVAHPAWHQKTIL